MAVNDILEPVTLREAKAHLRVGSENFGQDLGHLESIPPGSHDPTVGYTVLGTSVEVLGRRPVAVLSVGTLAADATVQAKLQESSDLLNWTDVVSGAFPTITAANAERDHMLEYRGAAQYIRVAAAVSGAASPFGASVALDADASPDDATLTRLISAARARAEDYTGLILGQRSFDLYLDEDPGTEYLLPLLPVVSVDGIFTTSLAGAETEFSADKYQVYPHGPEPFIYFNEVLPSGLRPYQGIRIRVKAGYSRTNLPAAIKQAVLMTAATFYERRSDLIVGTISEETPSNAKVLLKPHRLLPFCAADEAPVTVDLGTNPVVV